MEQTASLQEREEQDLKRKVRVIPRLDIKGPNVVKGIQLEGLRVVGKPVELAKRYYEQGADEILYIDIVASLYERNSLLDVVERTTSSGIFIPVTVGGGIRTIEDIRRMLRAGADKVAINTAATRSPGFIAEAAHTFGAQCIVGAIEAKRQGQSWEAYIDNGRERTGLDAIAWAKRLVELGAGELLVTSVDRDGTRQGMDIELLSRISEQVDVPIIACGGTGRTDDLVACAAGTEVDGLAFGTLLHYDETTIGDAKEAIAAAGFKVRDSTSNIPELQARAGKKSVSIIDYQIGNLKSVVDGFRSVGSDVRIISTPEELREAELLVLPGDGAFGYAMEQLGKQGLIPAIKDHVAAGKPLLGICLGMQLLMGESEEFGRHEGLNLIPGKVVPFKPKAEVDERGYVIPQMGWNAIGPRESPENGGRPGKEGWAGTVLDGVPADGTPEVYFIHSFYVVPENEKDGLAHATYGGQRFCAAVRKGRVYGVQFHPEKSGAAGMRIIEEFSKL